MRAAVLAAQQGALRANPATAVSVEAGDNPAARNPNVQAPVTQARRKPVAEQVADDLEQTLLEAMDIRADADGVLGVDEQVFEDLRRRIQIIGGPQANDPSVFVVNRDFALASDYETVPGAGSVERAAVQILARRYGVPEGASLSEAATTIAEGLAVQRMSLSPKEANVVPTDGSRRILDDPFPERPTSLEGAPPADELFEPIEVPVTERIPRFERDALGRIKVDGDGNPLARLSPDGTPTFEAVQRRRLMPHRVSDGQLVEAGEFMVIGRRRNTSDGNQSPEDVVFVLDRGDGTYQVSRPAAEDSPARAAGSQYDSQIVDQNKLGRLMVENEYGHISGPELGFEAVAPTVGEAESLGRMLAAALRPAPVPGSPDSTAFTALGREIRVPGTKNQDPSWQVQPGSATPEQLAEIVRRIDGLGDLFDGALRDRAMQAAGFQQAGNEMAFGRQLLDEARMLAEVEPSAPAMARPAATTAASPEFVGNVAPPRGPVSVDQVSAPVLRARDLLDTELLTPAQREARILAENTVSGPTEAVTDVVSGSAGEMFVPEFPTSNPADQFAGPAPPLYPPQGQIREGVLSGLSEVRPPRGGESMSMGEMSPASVIDTAIPAQTATMPPESAVPMPDELDVLRGLSDVTQPDTPVMNFQATPGSWAEGVSGRPVDVGGVDVARILEPDDADLARRAWTDLSNREAAARVLSERFPYIEDTEDLADIFRRMEQAGEIEPAFRDLDATEQFQMAQMSADELRELATELADEMAQTVNPNTLTQSQSVSAPTTDMDELAARVRQARGTTTSPGALFDITGRSIPVNQQGWPAGTESWSASAANPSAPAPTRTPADPSRVAFGFDNASGGVRRRLAEQREMNLQAREAAAKRMELVLYRAEGMWEKGDTTPAQIAASVQGDGDWFGLPEIEKQAVLEATKTPEGTKQLLDSAIAQSQAGRRRARGEDPVARYYDDPEPTPDVEAPDNVTDIEGLRDSAAAELEAADANAAFARENIPSDRGISLRRAQQIVRERLGLQRGDRLPLAFRGYDSRFSRRISESDVAQLIELRDFINKYERMSPEEYAQLRQRNTDLPRDKDENVQRLGAEFKALARQVSLDTIQDVDASGVNQSRLVQSLFSENPQARLNALRELFDVTTQGRKRPNDDGLTVLQRLADDPAYGSIENVLYDVLRRDPAINDPEAMSSRILDEAGQPVSAASMGPESLRSAAGTLAEDARRFASRTVSPEELRATGIDPTFQPAAPDAPEIRPSFVDRLLGRQAEPAPPQVVTRQGLDNAAEQIAAARTPEDMNAILAEINSTRDRVLSQLDDSNDPPVMDGPEASAPTAFDPRSRFQPDGRWATVRQGWAGEVEVRNRETPGVERSARQQIMERADELTEQWRRRMEQIQRGGDPETPRAVADASYEIEGNDAFSVAFEEARSSGAPMEEAIAAGNAARQALRERGGRQFTAEEADAAALPGGRAPSQLRPLTRGQAQQDLSASRAGGAGGRKRADPPQRANLANYTAVFSRDQEDLLNLGIEVRQQQLESIDARIAQLEQDATTGRPNRLGSEGVEPATISALRASRARLQAPIVTRMDDGTLQIQFTPNTPPVTGTILQPLETADGLEPPTFGPELAGVDFDAAGNPRLRRDGTIVDRRGRDVTFDAPPAATAMAGTLAATPRLELPAGYRWDPATQPPPPTSRSEPTARTDEEILDEFANPAGGPDEARIGGDIDESVRATGDPDIDAPANDYTYEGTPFVEDGPLSPGPGRTPRKSDGKPPRSLIKKATRAGVVGGLGLTGIQGGRMALAPFLAPTGIGYGAQDPMAAEGDINTAADPAGSRVRRARQQIVYGTTQNRLPY